MKIATLFLIVIAIQVSLLMFDMSYQEDTALFGFVKNPTNWSNTLFITLFGLAAAGITLAGAFVGSMIFGKTDIMLFAGMVATLIGFAIPITSLWQLISGEVGLFGGNIAAAQFTATILTAPLLLLAIFTIVNWWRGNSEM